ncbi:MAG: hypothetical protein LBF22_02110, partial [Deltaproteobacteria bacterium]|nr:hypothetical protein [Deltaproteobacteria bacterium]
LMDLKTMNSFQTGGKKVFILNKLSFTKKRTKFENKKRTKFEETLALSSNALFFLNHQSKKFRK